MDHASIVDDLENNKVNVEKLLAQTKGLIVLSTQWYNETRRKLRTKPRKPQKPQKLGVQDGLQALSLK